jgi:hypothetical protein
MASDIGEVRDVLRRAGGDSALAHTYSTVQDAVEAALHEEGGGSHG